MIMNPLSLDPLGYFFGKFLIEDPSRRKLLQFQTQISSLLWFCATSHKIDFAKLEEWIGGAIQKIIHAHLCFGPKKSCPYNRKPMA